MDNKSNVIYISEYKSPSDIDIETDHLNTSYGYNENIVINIAKEDSSVKSSDTFEEINKFDEFFTSYEYANGLIKNANANRDKEKLQNLKMELKNNKIIISKDEENKQKQNQKYNPFVPVNKSVIKNNNTNNNNINNKDTEFENIVLDLYSFDSGNEDYLKTNFIKSSGIKKKNNNFL